MTKIELFKRELLLRRYSQSTIDTYCSCLKVITSKIGENPSIEEIKEFLLTIKNNSYHKQIVGCIHKYFECVLKKKLSLKDIPYPRKEEKLPEILSRAEIQLIFNQINNLKHKSIASLLYGSGLRISEVINLKIADIDSSRMIINIRGAKGNKDRQVQLPIELLDLLRKYFTAFNPKEFLFNGQFGLKYSDRSINQLLKYYAKKAGIKKRVHAHKFRHSYATHLLDSGIDIYLIQKLLGHKKQETTEIYAKLSTQRISKIESPLSKIEI